MFKLLRSLFFGLKCPTPGCGGRLKQVKDSPRPTHDQFICTGKCKLSFTGSMLKQNRVKGYDKRDPTGRRRQAILQMSYECPVCYETFPMDIRKSSNISQARFQCPICKRYFSNPKYVKPEPVDIIVNTLVPPEQAPLPYHLCATCTQEISTCNGQPVFDEKNYPFDTVISCIAHQEISNEPTKSA
jgi:hypothetical protein